MLWLNISLGHSWIANTFNSGEDWSGQVWGPEGLKMLGPNWQARLCWLSLHLQQDDPCQPWWQPICSSTDECGEVYGGSVFPQSLWCVRRADLRPVPQYLYLLYHIVWGNVESAVATFGNFVRSLPFDPLWIPRCQYCSFEYSAEYQKYYFHFHANSAKPNHFFPPLIFKLKVSFEIVRTVAAMEMSLIKFCFVNTKGQTTLKCSLGFN